MSNYIPGLREPSAKRRMPVVTAIIVAGVSHDGQDAVLESGHMTLSRTFPTYEGAVEWIKDQITLNLSTGHCVRRVEAVHEV